MPKSQKQKKAKAADFTKAKLKLGKGKQVANNATNTSYSSKIIAYLTKKFAPRILPSQPRKALLGLRELLDAHRAVWRLNLGTVIHSCACLISDENPAVRKALKSFFSWFLPKVDLSLLKPFCSIIIFFASSALSHIFADIRVDAIYIIDILLDVAPNCVGLAIDVQISSQTAAQILSPQIFPNSLVYGFCNFTYRCCQSAQTSTAPGLSSTSANQLSGNSKLVVLKSLAASLAQQVLSIASSLVKTRCHCGSSGVHFARSSLHLRPKITLPLGSHTLNTEHYNSTNSHTFERFSEAFLESDDLQGNMSNPSVKRLNKHSTTTHPTPDNSLHLLRAMHPVMLSIFLDTAPTAFQEELGSNSATMTSSSSVGASVSPSLELVNCVVTSLHRLWQASLAADLAIESKDVKSLETILIKMAPYFIFGADDISPQGTELRHLLQNLNLMYCDLVSLLALVKPDCSNTVTIQLNQVGSYITRLLANKVISTNSNTGAMQPEAYRGIFPIVWSLLKHDLIQRENSKAERASWAAGPNSELKYLGVNFLARLCIMDDLPGCQLACELDVLTPETQDKLRQWMMGLPKLLWQLGTKNPATSHVSLNP
ncbi:hypothetical protein PSHT_16519, partial [Puccinia striiformis]